MAELASTSMIWVFFKSKNIHTDYSLLNIFNKSSFDFYLQQIISTTSKQNQIICDLKIYQVLHCMHKTVWNILMQVVSISIFFYVIFYSIDLLKI